MLKAITQKTVASLVLGVACLAVPAVCPAVTPIKLSGAIAGTVANTGGIPQMGATVILMNRQDRPIGKLQTDERGQFRFAGLFPDFYSIRITLATFFPAFKKSILVKPGERSVLNVNLSTLFSTIQISYPNAIESGSIMTDDWKWVLRSASSTRPVLRFVDVATLPTDRTERSAFSDTRGIVRVSAGDGTLLAGAGAEADMGTTFAVATSLYGNNLLHVSGNLGYGSQTGVPSAAFRTSYSRNFAGGNPEVSLTMRQMFLPARLSAALAGNEAALPMLRSMSAALDDRKEIAEHVSLQYGFTMDSVSFLDHLNYFSPYSKLTWAMDDGGTLEFAYSSGNARPDLAGNQQESDFQQDLNTLGLFPRISLRDARARVQRGEEYEVAYSRKIGSRNYMLSAYHESVRNAALSLVAPDGMYSGGDILPDLFTGNSIFNAGNFQNSGYTAGFTQNFGDHFSASAIYSSEGALTADSRELVSNSPDELRAMIHAGRKHAATTRISATLPGSGTHMIASYQWSSGDGWVMSGNQYSMQAMRPLPGLNLYIRQPLPRLPLLPRMEATADLRNMLAQGYLPLAAAGGQRLMLVETPRSFRGGFSFIF
jgi:Carboxypeptidase regulatory-like domain